VKDAAPVPVTVILVDSVGELLPLLGASSNSPDHFTRVHPSTLKALALTGAAVIAIDRLAKGTDSQAYASAGTAAKKRTIGGTNLRCTVIEPFRPGHGGKAALTIKKDRHGGLRAASDPDAKDKEPLAAVFELSTDELGDLTWTVRAPKTGERPPVASVSPDDIRRLSEFDPPPSSQRDVKARLHMGSQKARDARGTRSAGRARPRSYTPSSGSGEQQELQRQQSQWDSLFKYPSDYIHGEAGEAGGTAQPSKYLALAGRGVKHFAANTAIPPRPGCSAK
jgi:hypothetical protein